MTNRYVIIIHVLLGVWGATAYPYIQPVRQIKPSEKLMKKINISTDKYPNTYTIVSDGDYDKLKKWKWRLFYPHKKYSPYVVRSCRKGEEGWDDGGIKRKKIYMHNYIMNTPKGESTDHINHDTLDNRRENLRICSNRENVINSKRNDGRSKYKGVWWSKQKNRWIAEVISNKKKYHCGSFKYEKDAAKAYNKKAKELHGEFAYLNEV